MAYFHIALHARPAGIGDGELIRVADTQLQTLAVPPQLHAEPWAIDFESALAALEQLPRMFVELDGALVWVSPKDADAPWQLDGNLWDRDGRLREVELKGHCSISVWRQLLAALGCPPATLMVRLVRHGVFLGEPEFRRWALHS